jgi:hypothetical protein
MEKEFEPLFFETLLLIARFNDKFLELASLLRQLYETSHHDFKTLISIPQLGPRKGYYLVEIDKAFGGNEHLPCASHNTVRYAYPVVTGQLGSSMGPTTSINSSAAATPPSGDHRPPTLPPFCDGLQDCKPCGRRLTSRSEKETRRGKSGRKEGCLWAPGQGAIV